MYEQIKKKAGKTLGNKGHHGQKEITEEEGWRVDHSGVFACQEGVIILFGL